MVDKYGYPTDKEIRTIENWDSSNPQGLVEFIKEIWHWHWGFILKGRRVLRLELHTGGWSGNEDIISALNNNLFWTFYWEKSERGGHHYFKIKL